MNRDESFLSKIGEVEAAIVADRKKSIAEDISFVEATAASMMNMPRSERAKLCLQIYYLGVDAGVKICNQIRLREDARGSG